MPEHGDLLRRRVNVDGGDAEESVDQGGDNSHKAVQHYRVTRVQLDLEMIDHRNGASMIWKPSESGSADRGSIMSWARWVVDMSYQLPKLFALMVAIIFTWKFIIWVVRVILAGSPAATDE